MGRYRDRYGGAQLRSANVTATGTLSRFSYVPDPAGSRTAMTTTRLTAIGAGSATFTWGLADHITSATVGATPETYAWSGDGIRLTAVCGAGPTNTTGFVVDRNFGLPQLASEPRRRRLDPAQLRLRIPSAMISQPARPAK